MNCARSHPAPEDEDRFTFVRRRRWLSYKEIRDMFKGRGHADVMIEGAEWMQAEVDGVDGVLLYNVVVSLSEGTWLRA